MTGSSARDTNHIMRSCPLCAVELQEVSLHHEQVDICRDCCGIFLDNGELGSIVKMVKIFREIDLDEDDIDTISVEDHTRDLFCPVEGATMEPVDMSGVVVDVCPDCGGIWLDGGEMSALRLAESNLRANLNLYTRLGK